MAAKKSTTETKGTTSKRLPGKRIDVMPLGNGVMPIFHEHCPHNGTRACRSEDGNEVCGAFRGLVLDKQRLLTVCTPTKPRVDFRLLHGGVK